ncbi:GOLPH3/VPS74 family protein [Streptomyces zingiberis]|uniref:GPP34 family phosphoprotein n=1 Tax=Streptomyces zingiberis TaxID=2053010 RepID=A0ABX1C1I8_9ACTN|nr:GPP34 family phosphoprotein [Streptomyces zingiberis]NJQ02005.1 GPP34 family phosphoprotein [Streptomyces zingiberis]
MPTTLAQKLYLLCYTVKKEKFQLDNIQGRGQLLRAGAMTELARDGLLDATGGKVRRLPGAPPEDPFTAAVWYDLPEDKPKGWLKFLHDKAHKAETPVRDQLLAAGDVAVAREKKFGVVPFDRVTVVHPDLVHALQDRVRASVVGGAPAEDLTDELAMAVLAVELELTSVWSKEDRRTHKSGLTAHAARFDAFVPGLRKALRDSYLASRAVGGGWSA